MGMLVDAEREPFDTSDRIGATDRASLSAAVAIDCAIAVPVGIA